MYYERFYEAYINARQAAALARGGAAPTEPRPGVADAPPPADAAAAPCATPPPALGARRGGAATPGAGVSRESTHHSLDCANRGQLEPINAIPATSAAIVQLC